MVYNHTLCSLNLGPNLNIKDFGVKYCEVWFQRCEIQHNMASNFEPQ